MKRLYLSLFLIFPCLTTFSCAKTVKVTIVNEDETKGIVITKTSSYEVNQRIYLEAQPNEGFLFTGWYSDGIAISYQATYGYNVPNQDVTIIAKWENYSTQSFKFNQHEDIDHNITYSISNFFGTDEHMKVIVPSTHRGFPVTKIDKETFNLTTNIDVINIPEGIEEIGSNAFSDCKAKEVYLPSSLHDVGSSIFQYWSSDNEQRIYIPNASITPKEDNYETPWKWTLKKVEEQFEDITEDTLKHSGSIGPLIYKY